MNEYFAEPPKIKRLSIIDLCVEPLIEISILIITGIVKIIIINKVNDYLIK